MINASGTRMASNSPRNDGDRDDAAAGAAHAGQAQAVARAAARRRRQGAGIDGMADLMGGNGAGAAYRSAAPFRSPAPAGGSRTGVAG